jgi:hypothetical protein
LGLNYKLISGVRSERSTSRMACLRGFDSLSVCRKVALLAQHVAYVALGARDLPRDCCWTHPLPSKSSDLNASVLAARRDIDRAAPKLLTQQPRVVRTERTGQRTRPVGCFRYPDPLVPEAVGEPARASLTQRRRDHVDRQSQLPHFHPPNRNKVSRLLPLAFAPPRKMARPSDWMSTLGTRSQDFRESRDPRVATIIIRIWLACASPR